MEALRALEALDTLSGDAEKVLMEDIITNPYTTAYISARILGKQGYSPAIPLLRELADSQDYMLAGEAIIALARIRDDAFRPRVEEIILETQNPRLKIMGVQAFGIYRSPYSLSSLLDILKQKDPPPYLRDEVVLAMAGILHIQDQFYPLLVRFLRDLSGDESRDKSLDKSESLLETLALDETESALEFYYSSLGGRKAAERAGRREPGFRGVCNKLAGDLGSAASAYVRAAPGARLSRWILELPEEIGDPRVSLVRDPRVSDQQVSDPLVRTILSEAVLDDELSSFKRLRLLIVQWAAHALRAMAGSGRNGAAR
jgi:hypothetical protein